ncbi:MAG: tripartite tricarboxylate transporter substrate-binding protein, partial [Candidatus Zixiibacteriota bacterium]
MAFFNLEIAKLGKGVIRASKKAVFVLNYSIIMQVVTRKERAMHKDLKKKNNEKVGAWIFCLLLSFSIMSVCYSSLWAAGETYPNRPVTIIVPYPPGSSLDLHGQLWGEKLSKVLGQPFLRVNKPGAGGTLGASLVARGKADGYTIYPGTSSSLGLAPMIKKLDYGLEDFIVIGTYAKAGMNVVVKADAQWKTFEEF